MIHIEMVLGAEELNLLSRLLLWGRSRAMLHFATQVKRAVRERGGEDWSPFIVKVTIDPEKTQVVVKDAGEA